MFVSKQTSIIDKRTAVRDKGITYTNRRGAASGSVYAYVTEYRGVSASRSPWRSRIVARCGVSLSSHPATRAFSAYLSLNDASDQVANAVALVDQFNSREFVDGQKWQVKT